jgi:hypothetical protein
MVSPNGMHTKMMSSGHSASDEQKGHNDSGSRVRTKKFKAGFGFLACGGPGSPAASASRRQLPTVSVASVLMGDVRVENMIVVLRADELRENFCVGDDERISNEPRSGVKELEGECPIGLPIRNECGAHSASMHHRA